MSKLSLTNDCFLCVSPRDDTHIDPRRLRLIKVTETFLRTPYHHAARVKGVGIDCVGLLAEVYEEANIVPHIVLPFFTADWMMHRDEERFMMGIIEARLTEIQRPLPGDIALFRFGRCYSHGAIVTEWPEVIHAFAANGCVVRGSADKHPLLDQTGKRRPVKFYTALASQTA